MDQYISSRPIMWPKAIPREKILGGDFLSSKWSLLYSSSSNCSFFGFRIFPRGAKTTLLNEELDEEFYMEHPISFAVEWNQHKVWCLKRFIYGLKQSFRNWNLKLLYAMSLGRSTWWNMTLCVWKKQKRMLQDFSLYADEISCAENNLAMLEEAKS